VNISRSLHLDLFYVHLVELTKYECIYLQFICRLFVCLVVCLETFQVLGLAYVVLC
jgi:hypothetical protein